MISRRDLGKVAALMSMPRRPDQYYDPPSPMVAPGSRTGIVRARKVIVTGPTDGVFVYDSSGNLRSADVGQQTTDPVQGITCYQGTSTFNGHGAVISLDATALDAQLWYADTSTSTQGALIVSIASAAGSDPFSNPYPPGIGVFKSTQGTPRLSLLTDDVREVLAGYLAQNVLAVGNGQPQLFIAPSQFRSGAGLGTLLDLVGISNDGTVAGSFTVQIDGTQLFFVSPAITALVSTQQVIGAVSAATAALLEVEGVFALKASSAPAPVAGYAQPFANGNVLAVQNGAGLTGNVPVSQATDFTTFTVTAATFHQFSRSWTIPAGDANYLGARYKLTVGFTGTQGSTAQPLNLAAGGVFADNSIIRVPSGFAAANQAFAGYLVLDIVIATSGSSGKANVSGFVSIGAVGPSGSSEATFSAGLGFNCAVSNSIQVDSEWGSVTGAPTMTSQQSVLEKIF